MNLSPLFKLDALNGFLALAIGIFSVLIVLYSHKFVKNGPNIIGYYACVILSAFSALGVVLANNMLLLLAFWGFLGFTLYLLINMGDANAPAVAKKTFIIIGGSDALLLLGIGIIYYLTGELGMDRIMLYPNNALTVTAYLCLALACFAKAGVMPLHTWIPECAESAPVPVVAFLPASLDKLLGIYLLARCSLNLFVMSQALNTFLMLVGAITIIAAVMMALVQHNMKRLLGYHAVSQVGYMVLGIGTGTAIGIAGGIFHMLNHAIYKSCLFLTAGNVEYRVRTTELDKLGGLGRYMPLTYICALVASLSISGVPPFNGFISKWMIYQGLIEQLRVADYGLRITVVISLVAAMFGSALTLASFMKLIHAAFLGQRNNELTKQQASEVPWQMWLPCVILAGLCVIFGVFANEIPLRFFILPAMPGVAFIGSWYAGLSTSLILIGLALGILLFNWKFLSPSFRQDSAFTGSETVDSPRTRISGTDFYNTIKEFGALKAVYQKAEAGFFDIYEQGKTLVFGAGKFLQYLHNGVLPTYLVWTLLGMIGLFLVLMR